MTHQEKKSELEKVRYALAMASGLADIINTSQTISPEQAGDLRRRCEQVSSSSIAFECYMRGVDRPKQG